MKKLFFSGKQNNETHVYINEYIPSQNLNQLISPKMLSFFLPFYKLQYASATNYICIFNGWCAVLETRDLLIDRLI